MRFLEPARKGERRKRRREKEREEEEEEERERERGGGGGERVAILKGFFFLFENILFDILKYLANMNHFEIPHIIGIEQLTSYCYSETPVKNNF